MVQFSRLYMTTGKTIALTIQTFVNRVMSWLLNMLSRFIITSKEQVESESVSHSVVLDSL